MNEESVSEPLRKLVTYQRIDTLSPIEGADRIELAGVLGWKCIVKKGEFKVGDICLFHEVDSYVPVVAPATNWSNSLYAFLEKTTHKSTGRCRIRTMKLKGQLSQGLALPASMLKGMSSEVREQVIGQDMTEFLGVIKYEVPEEGGNIMHSTGRRPWPGYAPPKTDEVRIQSEPDLLTELLQAGDLVATQKLDGSSITVIHRLDGTFTVCSRNFEVFDVEGQRGSVYRSAVAQLGLRDTLPPGTAIQGELVGPGIQGNRLWLTFPDIYVFNVFEEIETGFEQVDYSKAVSFCRRNHLKHVPEVPLPTELTTASLVEASKFRGIYRAGPPEGIVIRSKAVVYSKALGGRRLSAKVINPDFEMET